MGAIQGAVNSVLGTAATVAAGAKHFSEQEATKAIAQAGTTEKLAIAKEELNELNEGIKQGKEDINTIKGGHLPGTLEADLFRSDEEKAADLQARRKALKTLKEKQAAKKLMIAAYQKVLGGAK